MSTAPDRSTPGELITLAHLTTLRVGGRAADLVSLLRTEDLLEAVRSLDQAGTPLLLLGGGSNVLASDDDLPATVLAIRTRGVRVESISDCGGATVWVAAGEPWDEFVAHTVEAGWVGVEALAGIPGRVGGTPIQNVGAYGQEVAQTIAAVRTYDRRVGRVRTFAAADCGFGYRSSRFKSEPGRFVVLEVGFQFRLGTLSTPVGYAELATKLGVQVGQRAPMCEVRAAVLALRRGKGMVLDEHDHDTWSAGSFFTNPIVPEHRLPAGAPRYPAPGDTDEVVKTSAAWLIEHAGFRKGYGLPGPAALSTKHTLALTNRGGATAADVLALARTVRDGVTDRYGITLENEPVLVGCAW